MGQVWRATSTRGRHSEHIDAFGDEGHSEHQKQYRLQAGKAGVTVGWGCLLTFLLESMCCKYKANAHAPQHGLSEARLLVPGAQ